MATETLKVLGIEQASKNLRAMADALQIRVTRKALRAAAKVILPVVKANTYKGDRDRRTGLLGLAPGISVRTKGGTVSALIKMRRVNIRAEEEIAAGIKRRNRKFSSKGKAKSSPFYWLFIERGTRQRRTRKGKDLGFVKPSPYVAPAFATSHDEALDQFTKVFNRETEKEAARLNKGKPR